MISKFKLGLFVVLISFLLLISSHFFGYTGHFSFDDMTYAELSHAFFQKQPHWDDTFTFRFGLVIPLGLLYLVFGVSDSVSALYPLILSFSLILLIYYHLKDDNYKVLIAIAILLSNPWIIFYSDKISVDLPITFLIFLAVTLLYKSRFSNYWQQKPIYGGSLFSLVIFLGLLTKETIWFLFPVVAFFMLLDLCNKQNLKFWISASLSLLILFFVYSFWQYLQFDNWFYRFNLIKKYDQTNVCSYDRQPFDVVFKRVSYELFLNFIKESAFILPIITLILCISKNIFKNIFAKQNFWLLSAIILVFSANFWSISYNSYHPLCLDIRHYLYIMPVSAVAISYNYQRIFKFWPILILLVSNLLILIFLEYFSIKEIAKLQSAWLILVFSLMLIFRKHQKSIFLLVVVLPFINVFTQIKGAQQFNYSKQREIGLEFIKDKDNTTIYTAQTQAKLFKYYLGYNVRNLKVIPYEYFDTLAKGYHYWNYHSAFSAGELGFVPPVINHFSIPRNLVFNTKDIKIWQIDPKRQKAKSNVYNLNESSLWTGLKGRGVNFMDISDEFSPTFKVFINNNVRRLSIASKWKLKKNDGKDATLVFSLEEDGKSIVWKPFSIKTDKSVDSNWYTLYKSIVLDNLEIKKEAELKVYIWNNFRTKLELMDASVELIED